VWVVYVCVCVHVCVCACICVCACVCMCVHVHVYKAGVCVLHISCVYAREEYLHCRCADLE